ncbi:MAG: hypothetical protein WD114_05785, partial [Phycisphaerales bacterium]
RVRTIYDFCERHGVYPTRGTWVLNPRRTSGLVNRDEPDEGVTLEDPAYLELCKSLKERGFEIGLHGVSPGDNTREDVIEGLNRFEVLLGCRPRTIFFHSHNAEHLYWGSSFTNSRLRRMLVRVMVPHKPERYEGHDPESPYFCGDVSFETFKYTRLFRTTCLNTIRKNPSKPYHLYDKPFVRHWFSTTAEDLDACASVTPGALERVARQDGLMLMYAHMGEKFVTDEGTVHPIAARAIELVGGRDDCWKTGVTALLDRCLAHKNLIVSRQRDATVIANPSDIDMRGVQVHTSAPRVFTAPARELVRNEHGAFVIDSLPARSTVALYESDHHAQIADPKGISKLEVMRMQYEEVKRLLILRRLKQLRKKLTGR